MKTGETRGSRPREIASKRVRMCEAMNCSTFEERISEYLDGTLPKQQAALVAAHALQCRDCRALLDDIKMAVEAARREGDRIAPPAHLENALLRIQLEQAPLLCADFEELITEFLDGFVPATLYHKFETHANDCCACASLLTEVVYAVAACHSVHTYEELEVPEPLTAKLLAVMPEPPLTLGSKVAASMAALAGWLMPRATTTRGWSYATASGLAVAVFAFLLFGFSDDGSVTGIYRQARAKAVSLYSHSSNLYSQKDDVLAGLEKVGSELDEMWSAIGGKAEGEVANQQPTPRSKSESKRGRDGVNFSVFGK